MDTRWLDETERRAWLGLLAVVGRLSSALDAQLQRDAGLSMFEYLVLAMLSEQPDRTLQLKSLAVLTNGSLSRLSHVLTRLERRGLTRRAPSGSDGRVTVATLTDTGWDTIAATAPAHVAQVRALVFDPLTRHQVEQLAAITERIGARLRDG